MKIPFTKLAEEALTSAQTISKKLKHYYVGSEHLLAALLYVEQGTAYSVLSGAGITYEGILDLIKDITVSGGGTLLKDKEGFTPRTERIIENTQVIAERYENSEIGTEHVLLAILEDFSSTAVQIIVALRKNPQQLYIDTLRQMGLDDGTIRDSMKKAKKKKETGSFLSQYSKDLTKLAKEDKLDPVIGRNEEISRVIQTLSRRVKNNPCLVGDPGVGKTAIVEGLALRIANGEVPATVKDKRVLTLDLSGLVAGTKYRGEFEERMKKLINEVVEAGDVILFLDELHTLIGTGGSEGSMDAANMLKPALSRGELQLIGATTMTEYRKYIEKDAALERRFQPIEVKEPTTEEAMRIIAGIAPKYEEHHQIKYTDEAIEAAVLLADRYINDRFLPDKAIDLLDEAGAAARVRDITKTDKAESIREEIFTLESRIANALTVGDVYTASDIRKEQDVLYKKLATMEKRSKREHNDNVVVNEDNIADIVAMWTKVPVRKLKEKESDRLLKLEDTLHKRVIGQEEAVTGIAKAIRRQRVGLQDPERPIGSFLFLGPTGVGKTELSKALAEAMFGSEDSLIRVDMSEYMESHSVSKLIGSPPGYVGFDDGGQLCEKVRRNPYSVVLFDEIEKAHPDVFNILLQVLDDGHITDSKGRKVNFKNTIIIMTSNAGAQRIVDPKYLGFTSKSDEAGDYQKMKGSVMEEVKKMFKPEFINRIDDIVVFHSLNRKNLLDICTLLSKNLCKRCKDQMNIDLSFSKELKEYIIDKFADTKMGARPIKRAIQSFVEDPLSEEILKKSIKPGDSVVVKVKDDKAVFQLSQKGKKK